MNASICTYFHLILARTTTGLKCAIHPPVVVENRFDKGHWKGLKNDSDAAKLTGSLSLYLQEVSATVEGESSMFIVNLSAAITTEIRLQGLLQFTCILYIYSYLLKY